MSSESGIDALSEGATLGKYRISKRLGEGGMGVVYAAMHERLGRPVAIKILRRELSRNEEQSSRFQMEAELVTRIGHPNIVAVYDFGRLPDDSLYFVMEMIKGESLRDRLLKKPLSDQEIVKTFGPLLSALRAAHGIGVVHRDAYEKTMTCFRVSTKDAHRRRRSHGYSEAQDAPYSQLQLV